MVLPNVLPAEDEKTAAATLCRKRNRWLIGFSVSSIAGVCAGLTGLAISALWALGFLPAAPDPDRLGTWLVAAAFPLLILAAHCLDKTADVEKCIKAISYHRQNK